MIQIYKSRFWIVFLASFLCWFHTLQWSTWGPISESMIAAFPGWDSSTVALMVNWGIIMYILTVIPFCWGMQRYGLRAGVMTSCTFIAIGTGIRCITKETPVFTIMCHISAMMVGAASSLALSTPIIIANDWFPPRERTTASGIILGCSQLGALGSYLEPLLVRPPQPGTTNADIQQDVMHLVYAGAIMAAAMLLAVLIYYPSKPPRPPSISSTKERIQFLPSLASIIKNKQFLLLLATYGVFVGPPLTWITMLNFSVLPLGFHQDKTMLVGVTAVLVSSVTPVITGRCNDLLQGHIKTLILILMVFSTAFGYWFLLLSYGVLEVTDWQVYASIAGVCGCNYAAMPLFFEAATDMTFPTSDILLAGLLTAADCCASTLFLIGYSVSNTGHQWVSCALTMSSSFCIIPLLFLKFENTRAQIDSRMSD